MMADPLLTYRLVCTTHELIIEGESYKLAEPRTMEVTSTNPFSAAWAATPTRRADANQADIACHASRAAAT